MRLKPLGQDVAPFPRPGEVENQKGSKVSLVANQFQPYGSIGGLVLLLLRPAVDVTNTWLDNGPDFV